MALSGQPGGCGGQHISAGPSQAVESSQTDRRAVLNAAHTAICTARCPHPVGCGQAERRIAYSRPVLRAPSTPTSLR